MAEKVAHLSSTNSNKPSIFEFAAQDSLSGLLHPAVKKVVDALYFKYPQCERIWYWFDEFYLGFNTLLELYYLKKSGSSFAENIYGLQRFGRANESFNLSRKEILASLFCLSVVPYIRNRLNSKAEELYFTDVSGRRKVLKDVFIKTNSAIQISLQVAIFVQYLRYLSGKSDFLSPYLWFAGLKLKYSDFNDGQISFRDFIPNIIRKSLEMSAFFLQFYNWWQTDNSQGLTSLPNPPPPQNAGSDVPSGHCPICGKPREIDTALAVSGYVYCFFCINEYIQENQRCPVTNIPATFNDLIRLYPPGS